MLLLGRETGGRDSRTPCIDRGPACGEKTAQAPLAASMRMAICLWNKERCSERDHNTRRGALKMGPAGSVSGPRHVPWHAALYASIRAERDSPYTRWVACFGGSRQASCRQDCDMSERACGASCSRRRFWAATTGHEEHAAGVRCLLPDPVRCLMRMQRSWRRVSFAAPTGRSIGLHTGPMSQAGNAQCLVRLCAAARGPSRTKPASTALGFFLAF
jgi:hypothetical protein